VNSDSHVEDMIVGLRTFLLAQLPAYLTAIAAAKTDAITQPMPGSDDIVLGAMDLHHYDHYPVVFLVPIGEEYESLTPSTDLIRATIAIWLVIGGFETSDLNKMIWRYGAELRNVLRDYPTWSGTVEVSIVKEVAYFPVVLGEDELQAVRVTVTAEKELS
jgi:hypothetical protein